MNGLGRDVRIVGIDVPFWDLVWLLVKATIAWIPAFILLCLIAVGVLLTVALLFGVVPPALEAFMIGLSGGGS